MVIYCMTLGVPQLVHSVVKMLKTHQGYKCQACHVCIDIESDL